MCGSVIGQNLQKTFLEREEMRQFFSMQNFRNSYICATNLLYDFFGLFSLKEALKCFDLIERAGSLISAKSYIPYNSKSFQKYYYNRLPYFSKTRALDICKKNELEFNDSFFQVTFLDTLNHYLAGVERLGEIMKMPKMTYPKVAEDINNWRIPINSAEWQELISYNLNDTKITYSFMDWYQKTQNDLGASMKLTIAATSMDLFRRKYLKSFWKQEPRQNIIFAYQSYKGGRTEAFIKGRFSSSQSEMKDADKNYGNISVYDVNSLYPYCLTKFRFPVPSESYFTKKISDKDIHNFNGCGYFDMKSPLDMDIPFLFYKPNDKEKLRFPLGNIRGYYDFNSIRYALNNGYEIIKTGKGLIYENTFTPFKGMMTDLFKLKKDYTAQGREDLAIVPKIDANSFYGRLGFQFQEKESLGTMDDFVRLQLEYANKNLLNAVEAIKTKDKDILRIITTENSKIPNYVFPIIPQYVTSYAREVMHRFYKQVGYDRILYTDTDSIFTTRKMQTGTEIGEMKLEKLFSDLIIVKPKFYGGIDLMAKEEKKRIIVKVKGVKDKIKVYDNFIQLIKNEFARYLGLRKTGFQVSNRHFRKIRGSIGNNAKYINEVYLMDKEMELEDDKRIWEKERFTLEIQKSKPMVI